MKTEEQTIHVDLKDAIDIKCTCGSSIFLPGFRVKKISALLSPTGKEMFLPIQTLICYACESELGEGSVVK